MAGNYSVAPADGTGAHLALDCGGHARAFTLDLSNSTLVMQALPGQGFASCVHEAWGLGY